MRFNCSNVNISLNNGYFHVFLSRYEKDFVTLQLKRLYVY